MSRKPPEFRKGDRVRLAAAGKTAGVAHRTQQQRHGVVAAEPRQHTATIAVIWDGAKTLDRYAPTFLVRVSRVKP